MAKPADAMTAATLAASGGAAGPRYDRRRLVAWAFALPLLVGIEMTPFMAAAPTW